MNKKQGHQTQRAQYQYPPEQKNYNPNLDQDLVKLLQTNHTKRLNFFPNNKAHQENITSRTHNSRSPSFNNKFQNRNITPQKYKNSNLSVSNFSALVGSKSNNNKQSQLQQQYIFDNNIEQKSEFKQTLQLLKRKRQLKCKISNHESSKTSYICIEQNCSEKQRLGCAHCFIELHKSHRKIKVDQFMRDFTQKYLQYMKNFQVLLKGVREVKSREQKAFEAQLQLLQDNFQIHLQKLKNKMTYQIKKQLNGRLRSQYRIIQASQNFFSILHALQYSQNNKQSLATFDNKLDLIVKMNFQQQQICFPLIQQLKRLRKIQQQKQRLCQIINGNYFKQLNNSINQLFFRKYKKGDQDEKVKDIIMKQYDSMTDMQQCSIKKLANLLKQKQFQNNQIVQDISKQNDQIKCKNTQINYSKKSKEVFRICSQSSKLFLNPSMYGFQQLNFILQNNTNQQYVNTLTLFKCCGLLFCCSDCHDSIQDHSACQSVPSTRLCINCNIEIQVPFIQSIPINCKNCVKKMSNNNNRNHTNASNQNIQQQNKIPTVPVNSLQIQQQVNQNQGNSCNTFANQNQKNFINNPGGNIPILGLNMNGQTINNGNNSRIMTNRN